MADRRRPSERRGPASSRLRESCSPPAAAGDGTAQFFAILWTASNPPAREKRERRHARFQPRCAQATNIAARANSSDIHASEITLQYGGSNLKVIKCPSNREGLRDSLGGSGLSFLFCLRKRPVFIFSACRLLVQFIHCVQLVQFQRIPALDAREEQHECHGKQG